MNDRKLRYTSIGHSYTATGESTYQQAEHEGRSHDDCISGFHAWCTQNKMSWAKLIGPRTGAMLATYTDFQGLVVCKHKTDAVIVEETNKLARQFYLMRCNAVLDDFKFYESRSPMMVSCWEMAVEAYRHIDGTPVMEALMELQLQDNPAPWR